MNHPLLAACRQQHDCITLHRSTSGWMAASWGSLYEETVSLFGTNVIPTAFTARADAEMVRSEIQRLNPGVEVIVGVPSEL